VGTERLLPSSRAVPGTAAVLAGFSSVSFSRRSAAGQDGRAEGRDGAAFAAGAAERPNRPLRSSHSAQAVKGSAAGFSPF